MSDSIECTVENLTNATLASSGKKIPFHIGDAVRTNARWTKLALEHPFLEQDLNGLHTIRAIQKITYHLPYGKHTAVYAILDNKREISLAYLQHARPAPAKNHSSKEHSRADQYASLSTTS